MKDLNNNKTQDQLEVTMPLEVAQAALAAMNKVFLDWDVLNEAPPEYLILLNGVIWSVFQVVTTRQRSTPKTS